MRSILVKPRRQQKQRPKFSLPLIKRQVIWLPTWQGWGLLLITFATLFIVTVTQAYPFLAVNAPIHADTLVVEGWVSDAALQSIAKRVKRGRYHQVLTVGIPLDVGFYLSEYGSFAELSAASLKALGVPDSQVTAIPANDVKTERTYASAIALKQWLATSGTNIKAVNLFSEGPHARRSWLIFQRALAPNVSVGVLNAQPKDYRPEAWWETSAGVKSVLIEGIGYLYAQFINWRI